MDDDDNINGGGQIFEGGFVISNSRRVSGDERRTNRLYLSKAKVLDYYQLITEGERFVLLCVGGCDKSACNPRKEVHKP